MQSDTSTTSRCPRCGASLECGAATGQCWCMARPPLGFNPGYGSCLCAQCLEAVAEAHRQAQATPKD